MGISETNIGEERSIIFDACTGHSLKKFHLSQSTTIIGADRVNSSISLAKLLYDATIYQGNNLEKINQNTFNKMKHNWVYCNK